VVFTHIRTYVCVVCTCKRVHVHTPHKSNSILTIYYYISSSCICRTYIYRRTSTVNSYSYFPHCAYFANKKNFSINCINCSSYDNPRIIVRILSASTYRDVRIHYQVLLITIHILPYITKVGQ